MVPKLGTITKYDKFYNNKMSIAKDRKHTKTTKQEIETTQHNKHTTKEKIKAKQSA